MSLSLSNISGIISAGTFSLNLSAYFSKPKEVFPYVDQLKESSPPAFEGTLDQFLEKYKDESLKKRGKNKVRKCPSCTKPVAFTLPLCNGCGTNLTQTEISYTNNIFVGFVYGVQKGPFPFTISLRLQTPEYLVFDDLLALCPCHLNVIPTKEYLPDWRYLLMRPKEGRALVEGLFDRCWEVVLSQFLGNEEWRRKIIRGTPQVEELKAHIAVGFNYPPSQYQLHLQFMLPPFTPFHYYQYQNNLHFTIGRFFPIEYVRAVLDLDLPYDIKEDTPIEDIIKFYDSKGVSYEKIHATCYSRYGSSHNLLANYVREDFEGFVVGNKFFRFSGDYSKGEETQEDVKGINERDKLVLQNYGRPYLDGKPSGTYYKYAKRVEDNDVRIW